jgi:hypothetical protein
MYCILMNRANRANRATTHEIKTLESHLYHNAIFESVPAHLNRIIHTRKKERTKEGRKERRKAKTI